ncbi:MAG: hypothetical protein EPN48_05440 [Microbacteriaceae bacterium]|nr:MAG: hypothetical protein EPN48_05440 [Microbacteriaceae bacterium]
MAIVFAPIALAGATWDATKGWFAKWAGFVIALIASKLVLVVIFLVAITQVSAPINADLTSVSQPIAGVALMFIAAFAPYISYEFLHFAGFDMYHAMSAEQEAKQSLNRPVPIPSRPGSADTAKKVLDGGSLGSGGASPSPGGGGAAASTGGAGTAAGASTGEAAAGGGAAAGGAAGAGAAAGPIGAAAVAGAAVVKSAATAGPKAGAAIGGAAEDHAAAASEQSAPPPPSAPTPSTPAAPSAPPPAQRTAPPAPRTPPPSAPKE